MTDRQAKLLCIPVGIIVFSIWFRCGVLWERKHSQSITVVKYVPSDESHIIGYAHYWLGDTITIFKCTNP